MGYTNVRCTRGFVKHVLSTRRWFPDSGGNGTVAVLLRNSSKKATGRYVAVKLLALSFNKTAGAIESLKVLQPCLPRRHRIQGVMLIDQETKRQRNSQKAPLFRIDWLGNKISISPTEISGYSWL